MTLQRRLLLAATRLPFTACAEGPPFRLADARGQAVLLNFASATATAPLPKPGACASTPPRVQTRNRAADWQARGGAKELAA